MSAGATAEAATLAPPRPRRRWTRFVLPTYVVLVLLVTLVPIAVMVLYGFNQAPSDRLTFAWNGFTLDWYARLFEVSDLTAALIHSLEIASLSTLIATALGTPAALALARYRFRGRSLSDMVILADIAAPSVVVGASLLGFFVYLGVPRGFTTILIAHVAFNIAFVVVVVQARVTDLDEAVVEAAQDLGANPWVAFWRVTFPLIFPGILAAALSRRGFRFVGVDLSPAMLGKARERLGNRVAVGNARRLPVREGSVEQALSVWVLHVAGDVPGILAEVARALVPGGRYAIMPGGGQQPLDEVGRRGRALERALDPERRRDDSAERVAALAPAAGFRVKDTVDHEWTWEEPPAAVAARIESRSMSYLWDVDDEAFDRHAAPFVDWLRSLPEPERPIVRRARDTLIVLERD